MKQKELELKEKEIAVKKELYLNERELAMKKELVQEFKEKELDMLLQLKELELKSRVTQVTKEASSSSVAKESIDFICHAKLLPSFQEYKVDKFFYILKRLQLTYTGCQRYKLCCYKVF